MWVCLSKLLDVLGWNFAQRWSLRGEGSWGCFDLVPPPPGMGCVKGVWEDLGASTVHFGKNFIKQKMQGTPNIVGVGHLFGPQIWIQKDLGSMSFWSHGHSLWRGVHKTKIVWYVPNSYLMRLDTPYPDPRGPGGVLEPQGCILAKTL